MDNVRARFAGFAVSARHTNFYPRYNEANDQVDRVSKIQPITFQRIIPKYRLSTSETRDAGTGPMFDEIPVYTNRNLQRYGAYSPRIRRWFYSEARKGIHVDVYA